MYTQQMKLFLHTQLAKMTGVKMKNKALFVKQHNKQKIVGSHYMRMMKIQKVLENLNERQQIMGMACNIDCKMYNIAKK